MGPCLPAKGPPSITQYSAAFMLSPTHQLWKVTNLQNCPLHAVSHIFLKGVQILQQIKNLTPGGFLLWFRRSSTCPSRSTLSEGGAFIFFPCIPSAQLETEEQSGVVVLSSKSQSQIRPLHKRFLLPLWPQSDRNETRLQDEPVKGKTSPLRL